MKDIQGIQRGKCNGCECAEYRAPSDGGKCACDYCGHRPADHVRIVELGACRDKDCDCDKYSPEDPNSYSDCQYCGCKASQHAGSEALRKPKPVAAALQNPQTATVPVMTVAGTTGQPSMPQGQGSGIQPRMSATGVPLQSPAHGTCSNPGCPYPKRIEAGKVHSYCSRSCARTHGQMQSGFHTHKLASADQAAKSGGSTGSSSQTGKVTVTTAAVVGPGSVKMCKKCNQHPTNPGRGWCESCYRQGQLQ